MRVAAPAAPTRSSTRAACRLPPAACRLPRTACRVPRAGSSTRAACKGIDSCRPSRPGDAAPTCRTGGDNPRMSATCNIAAALPALAAERPDQVAIRCPGRAGRYDVALSYAQLDARSDAVAAGLARRGVSRGTRTVVMVRPTPEFFLV